MFLVNLKSLYPFWAIYFQGVGARVSLKVAPKGSRKGKKVWKFRFLGCFSKSKMEEWDQNVWNIFHQFYITILCSTTYLLEVYACVLLKVDTKGSPRGKKKLWKCRLLGFVSKEKMEECNQQV